MRFMLRLLAGVTIGIAVLAMGVLIGASLGGDDFREDMSNKSQNLATRGRQWLDKKEQAASEEQAPEDSSSSGEKKSKSQTRLEELVGQSETMGEFVIGDSASDSDPSLKKTEMLDEEEPPIETEENVAGPEGRNPEQIRRQFQMIQEKLFRSFDILEAQDETSE